MHNYEELSVGNSLVDEQSERTAQQEISRIFESLNLPDAYKSLIFQKFKNIWPQMIGENIYGYPETLVSLIIYLYFRSLNIPISSERLIESSKINRRDFYYFLFQIIEYATTSIYRSQLNLTIDLFETENEKKKFKEFMKFLKVFSNSNCPLCYKVHNKEDLMTFYFSLSREVKKKLLKQIDRLNLHINSQ